MIDDNFICEKCKQYVFKLGYTARDHCNHCLYSKHVDINPGDNLIVLGDEGQGLAIIQEKNLLDLLKNAKELGQDLK